MRVAMIASGPDCGVEKRLPSLCRDRDGQPNGGRWAVLDDEWFRLKRWLGDAAMAETFSHLSASQAVALLDGFCRGEGMHAVRYDEASGEPTGDWQCSHSSFPLIDHLMLIAQLAGAAVDLVLSSRSGANATAVDGVPDHLGGVDWQLTFTFAKSALHFPAQSAPLGRPVDVSDDVDACGYYQHVDDGRVYCIAVQHNSNFLTQRLARTRAADGRSAVRAQPVFSGNCAEIVAKVRFLMQLAHQEHAHGAPGEGVGAPAGTGSGTPMHLPAPSSVAAGHSPLSGPLS